MTSRALAAVVIAAGVVVSVFVPGAAASSPAIVATEVSVGSPDNVTPTVPVREGVGLTEVPNETLKFEAARVTPVDQRSRSATPASFVTSRNWKWPRFR